MTLESFLSTIAALSGLLFVVTSMLGMGLSLTTAQILQPLKNVRLVILALLANFVLVPLLAFGITRLIPMDQSLQIGLIVLSTVAGRALPREGSAGCQGGYCAGGRAHVHDDGRDHYLCSPCSAPAAAGG